MEHGLQEVLFVEPHVSIERAQQYAKGKCCQNRIGHYNHDRNAETHNPHVAVK